VWGSTAPSVDFLEKNSVGGNSPRIELEVGKHIVNIPLLGVYIRCIAIY